MHKTLVHYHHLPLKTSLNSPGGACRMKSEAMATYKGPEYNINGVINDRSKICWSKQEKNELSSDKNTCTFYWTSSNLSDVKYIHLLLLGVYLLKNYSPQQSPSDFVILYHEKILNFQKI